MPKKTTIHLTYRNKTLWWSSDKENWGVTGPDSPQSTLVKSQEIVWEGDDSIEEIELIMDNDEII
jgi:hypothetical protein